MSRRRGVFSYLGVDVIASANHVPEADAFNVPEVNTSDFSLISKIVERAPLLATFVARTRLLLY